MPTSNGTLKQAEQNITDALYDIMLEENCDKTIYRPSRSLIRLLHNRRGAVVRKSGKKRFVQMYHIPQAQNLTRWLKADTRFEENPIYCRSDGREFRIKEEYL
mgnify:CR=1 FL=1